MKDMLAAEVMTLILLKRAGVSMQGDLIFAAGADEETGGQYGFGWLAENAPDAIRADYALNEGGGGCIHTDKGLVYTVMVGEKGRLEVRITVRGRGAHASVPWAGDNPALKLAEILKRLEAYQPEINVSQAIFAALPSLLGRSEPITVDNVDAVADEARFREGFVVPGVDDDVHSEPIGVAIDPGCRRECTDGGKCDDRNLRDVVIAPVVAVEDEPSAARSLDEVAEVIARHGVRCAPGRGDHEPRPCAGSPACEAPANPRSARAARTPPSSGAG